MENPVLFDGNFFQTDVRIRIRNDLFILGGERSCADSYDNSRCGTSSMADYLPLIMDYVKQIPFRHIISFADMDRAFIRDFNSHVDYQSAKYHFRQYWMKAFHLDYQDGKNLDILWDMSITRQDEEEGKISVLYVDGKGIMTQENFVNMIYAAITIGVNLGKEA